MKVLVSRPGVREVVVEEQEIPVPGAGEVLIEVAAAAVNPVGVAVADG